MDVRTSLWGRKIRSIRPFILFFSGFTFLVQALET